MTVQQRCVEELQLGFEELHFEQGQPFLTLLVMFTPNAELLPPCKKEKRAHATARALAVVESKQSPCNYLNSLQGPTPNLKPLLEGTLHLHVTTLLSGGPCVVTRNGAGTQTRPPGKNGWRRCRSANHFRFS
jgi:hypothetical protein